jgi:SAM-dependent methyltransferase
LEYLDAKRDEFDGRMIGMDLQEWFGRIDIYVFDQILRGNIAPGMKVLDAGCGGGRNLVYLMREGYEVCGVDASAEAVAAVREMAAELAPGLAAKNFQVAGVERMPFADGFADVTICNSVLHFAQDDAHFEAMVRELWRTVKRGGMMFCRLGSVIGAAGTGVELRRASGSSSARMFEMVDGQDWYLVDEGMLMEWTRRLGGELVDPLKTTVVQGQRCMTTWVVRKG